MLTWGGGRAMWLLLIARRGLCTQEFAACHAMLHMNLVHSLSMRPGELPVHHLGFAACQRQGSALLQQSDSLEACVPCSEQGCISLPPSLWQNAQGVPGGSCPPPSGGCPVKAVTIPAAQRCACQICQVHASARSRMCQSWGA